MTRDIRRFLSVFLLTLSAFAAPAYAQEEPLNNDLISGYGLRNLENAVSITASPSSPNAGEKVTFTAESSILDLTKADITWTVNGKSAAHGVGVTSVSATVDSVGNAISVSLSAADTVWGVATSKLTLVPLQLDLLYDAPTYVPPFYRGRAMPSSGGQVRLQAIARFSRNGKLIPESSINYTWRRNGSVLSGVSGLGKSKITIEAAQFYDSDTINVTAIDTDETLSASASISVPSTKPVLQLYENHPLFGMKYFNAFSAEEHVPGELNVAAVPYFATVTNLNDANMRYKWEVNDAPAFASSTKRNEITLVANKETDFVHLAVSHAANFFIDVSANWKFMYGSVGGSSAAGEKADIFHSAEEQ